MKARIVERTRQNGTKKYLIQRRFLFWWFDSGEFEYDSLAEAKKKLCFYDGTKIVDRVVDEPRRDPDPVVGALVAKLGSVLEGRLKREKDPEGFLMGMRPHVVHEFKSWLPSVVNESRDKIYVLDSPIHGGKIIAVEGEFAQKILALGDLP